MIDALSLQQALNSQIISLLSIGYTCALGANFLDTLNAT